MKHEPRPRRGRPAAIIFSMALLAWPTALLADEFASAVELPEDCLARASLMINPGEALELRFFDGRSIAGRLVSFDLENRLVTLEQWDELGAARRQANADDVQRYEYSERSGKGTGVAGAILGSAIGAVVGVSTTSGDEGLLSGVEGAVGGIFIGGVVGYAVGSNMNSGYRAAGAIICDEK